MDYLVPTDFSSFTLRKEGKYHHDFLIKSNMCKKGQRLQIYFGSDLPENDIGAILVSLKRTKPCLFMDGLLCKEWEYSSVCLMFMAKHLIS